MKRLLQAAKPAALVLAMALAGCASFSGIEPRARTAEPADLHLQGEPVQLSDQWWRDLGDPQLDRLVDQALAGNPSLRLAQARLDRARSVLEVANSATRPQVNASADVTRQRYTEKGLIPPPIAGSVRDIGNLQLSAGWEIDFFGRYAQALEAALGSTRAAQADAEAARVLLAGNVVRAYVQAARVNDQLAVAERALAQRQQALGLVQDRVRAGLDSRLEQRQSESLVPEARQQIEALREQAALARNALAALVGRPTDDPLATPPRMASLRALPTPTQIPADLLGRRADIAAARWRVEAATHDVASTKASFYPNVNLTAFVGLSSLGLSNLLDAGARQWGLGPALRLPIFDAGRLRANLRGKTADLDAAVESYNQAVIDAVRETADQLASAGSIVRQQQEQALAAEAAESAYDLAVQRYKGGLGNYLQVLTAENAVLAQRRLAVDLGARALETQVGLARALGGGWKPETPSTNTAMAGTATHP